MKQQILPQWLSTTLLCMVTTALVFAVVTIAILLIVPIEGLKIFTFLIGNFASGELSKVVIITKIVPATSISGLQIGLLIGLVTSLILRISGSEKNSVRRHYKGWVNGSIIGGLIYLPLLLNEIFFKSSLLTSGTESENNPFSALISIIILGAVIGFVLTLINKLFKRQPKLQKPVSTINNPPLP